MSLQTYFHTSTIFQLHFKVVRGLDRIIERLVFVSVRDTDRRTRHSATDSRLDSACPADTEWRICCKLGKNIIATMFCIKNSEVDMPTIHARRNLLTHQLFNSLFPRSVVPHLSDDSSHSVLDSSQYKPSPLLRHWSLFYRASSTLESLLYLNMVGRGVGIKWN